MTFINKRNPPPAGGASLQELQAVSQAIDRVMARIEFTPEGRIIRANQNFLQVMGFRQDEIAGQHHRIFMPPGEADAPDYASFWSTLKRGEYVAREFRRIKKGGAEVWLQASYNPVFGKSGAVEKVIKFATDITAEKSKALDHQTQIEAVNRSLAAIQFSTDGTILDANDNFLKAMGYSRDEIVGKHHRMFVPRDQAASSAYAEFWHKLSGGDYQSAEFERVHKTGRAVWIQATYNPVRGIDGRVQKIVKFATDVTERVLRQRELTSLIERDLPGITRDIGQISHEAEAVSDAASRTASTIENIAAATEELNASVREISADVAASKQSTEAANAVTAKADASTRELHRSAQQMTGIVELIDDIAAQINLLALNATIESARAGEAGRGFAVVAAEVKQLASQVSSATRTISNEIEGVQSVAGDVVTALNAIQSSVGDINTRITSVAAAVSQQTGATNEISRTMQAASGEVQAITGGINSAANSIRAAASSTDQVRTSIEALIRSA